MAPKRVKSKRFASGYGWQIDVRRKGMKRKRLTFPDKQMAQDVEDALVGDHVKRRFNLPVDSHVPLGELVERHLATMKRKGRDKTNLKRAETVLERFRDPVGADRLVESIKTADLNDYVEMRYSGKRRPQPQTVNRELTEIKSCLTAAATYFRTLEGYRSPKAPWQEEPQDGRRQTRSATDDAAVLGELLAPKRPGGKDAHVEGRHAVADMFVIARRTGMRLGEVRKLHKRRDLDFAARIIRVTSRKGIGKNRPATTREIPMPDDVYEILKRRCESGESE